MAHGKLATKDYVASRGVLLECLHSYNFFITDGTLRDLIANGPDADLEACYYAHLAPDRNFLARFPIRADSTLARFPRLHFVSLLEMRHAASESLTGRGGD